MTKQVGLSPVLIRRSLFPACRKHGPQLMGLLEEVETQAERKMVYLSIGSCPTPSLKRQVLEWSLTSVKLQDFFYPMSRC